MNSKALTNAIMIPAVIIILLLVIIVSSGVLTNQTNNFKKGAGTTEPASLNSAKEADCQKNCADSPDKCTAADSYAQGITCQQHFDAMANTLYVTYGPHELTAGASELTITVKDKNGIPISGATISGDHVTGAPVTGTTGSATVAIAVASVPLTNGKGYTQIAVKAAGYPDSYIPVLVSGPSTTSGGTTTTTGTTGAGILSLSSDQASHEIYDSTSPMTITVTDEKGAAVIGATITYDAPCSPKTLGTTDSSGKISFKITPDEDALGDISLTASKTGYTAATIKIPVKNPKCLSVDPDCKNSADSLDPENPGGCYMFDAYAAGAPECNSLSKATIHKDVCSISSSTQLIEWDVSWDSADTSKYLRKCVTTEYNCDIYCKNKNPALTGTCIAPYGKCRCST